MNRRAFLKLLAIAGAGIAGSGLAYGYAKRVEPWQLRFEEVTIRSPRIPPALDGLTIGQISDTHHSTVVPGAFIERAVRELMARQPDVIALTGDYLSADGDPEQAAQVLTGLAAPLGVYAVLGNHDHWHPSGAARMAQALRSAIAGRQFEVLLNDSRTIDVGGASLHIAGVDDVWEQQHDLRRAVAGLPPNQPAILLAHEPDLADEAAATHPFALQLSGHSHGGQVRVPFIGAPLLPRLGQKFPIGLQRAGEMFVYTSRGVGMIAPAVRFNCPPEVTLITLRSQPNA